MLCSSDNLPKLVGKDLNTKSRCPHTRRPQTRRPQSLYRIRLYICGSWSLPTSQMKCLKITDFSTALTHFQIASDLTEILKGSPGIRGIVAAA